VSAPSEFSPYFRATGRNGLGSRLAHRRLEQPSALGRESSGRGGDGRSDALRKAIDAAADAFVVTDAHGRILEWNRQAELLFGYQRAEVLGHELTLFTPSGEAEQPLPRLAHDTNGSVGRRMVMPAVDRDGQSVPVELTVWPARWGRTQCYGGVFRVLSQPAAQQLLCRVGSIVESSDAAISSEGLDGRILTWNRAAELIYGYTAAEAIGHPASMVVPPELADEVESLVEGARNGEPVANHETIRLRKDGSTVEVAVTISPVLDMGGHVVGVSTIARDITEQRRMAKALEVALEESRAAEARMRQFLADAAHQLRNPLAGLRACADSLLRTTSVASRERLLAHLIDDAARAGRLVDQLLKIARLDQGEHRLNLAPIDVVAMCRAEANRVVLMAPHLDVHVVAADGARRPFLLDEAVLREVLGNLLDNAGRYARRSIRVGIRQDGDLLLIGVSDDGPGVPADKVEHVFERFTTLDAKSGSGLGLPIARDLARSHGGDLAYEGGEFLLSIPAVGAEAFQA
jgi:PAS domain S-box-containing protein